MLQSRLQRRGKTAVFLVTLFTLLVTGVHLTFINLILKGGTATPESPSSPGPLPATPAPAEAREAFRVVEGSIRKGAGLGASLREKGLPATEIEPILSRLAPVLDFRRLRPGERYVLEYSPGNLLERFSYRTGPLEQVVMLQRAGSWEVRRETIPYTTKVETVTGTITTSLFEGLERAGERDRLAMEFVDIFAWDIDFSHELQRGDTYRIVVEKIYRDGEFLTYGKILAAQYRDSEELHEAFYYPYPEDGGGYYDPKGTSVRKTFLKAPVSYSRISSGYSRRRLHPVLKKVRPHLGIDYAAPTGTAVWAAADGLVTSVSRDGRNGRKVVIRHPGGYETYYLHLSRFAKALRRGRKVRQKEVLGYVGSSGLSTGPHLDYRMKRHGRWINPLREKFPPGDPLPPKFAASFGAYTEWLTGELSTPAEPFFASADTPSPGVSVGDR